MHELRSFSFIYSLCSCIFLDSFCGSKLAVNHRPSIVHEAHLIAEPQSLHYISALAIYGSIGRHVLSHSIYTTRSFQSRLIVCAQIASVCSGYLQRRGWVISRERLTMQKQDYRTGLPLRKVRLLTSRAHNYGSVTALEAIHTGTLSSEVRSARSRLPGPIQSVSLACHPSSKASKPPLAFQSVSIPRINGRYPPRAISNDLHLRELAFSVSSKNYHSGYQLRMAPLLSSFKLSSLLLLVPLSGSDSSSAN